jgi:dTDP-4-amino-4,6-dideoxygalactose transaminase
MIPIADPDVGGDGKERVLDVLDSGMLADGPEVRKFESEFADFCGADHGVATSNGTTALHAAIEALGLGEGDRVLTTPFSFVASANAIWFAGAEPVFADIDPETYNLDPDAVEAVLREQEIDAIVAVHLYGLPAAMERLTDLAEEYDIALVEDAAQAHGAAVNGRRVGSFGDAACFSFYPTKNMTTGEGGMITTYREDVADRAAQFINHGRNDKYEHERLGHNFRMTSIAAAVGRSQLERLPAFTERRRANARRLTEGLAETSITTPTEPSNRRHVYHQYTVRVDDREVFQEHMEEAGVGTGVYYPTPIHEQPAYGDHDGSYPVAERAADEVVSLPIHPNVSESDVEKVTGAAKRYVTRNQQST